MKLNDDQKAALQRVVAAKIALWDASLIAERFLGEDREIDTGSEKLDYLCSNLGDPASAFTVSEETLIEVFEL